MDSQKSEQASGRQDRTSVLGVAILVVIFAGILLLLWNRSNESALTDYAGVIVDRWAGYSSSEQGSRPYFRLLIEQNTQERISVNVDAETFQRSRVGMKIVSRNGKVELTEAQAMPDK